MTTAPALRLVPDPTTGEIPDEAPTYSEALRLLSQYQDELVGQDKTIRSLGAKIQALLRDKEAEARRSELWPIAERCFLVWKNATGTGNRASLTLDRFELVAPRLKGAEADTFTTEAGPPRNALEECFAAIVGRVTDHFSKERPNGTVKHFWEFERCVGHGKTAASMFEESKARRPRDWRARAAEWDEGPR